MAQPLPYAALTVPIARFFQLVKAEGYVKALKNCFTWNPNSLSED